MADFFSRVDLARGEVKSDRNAVSKAARWRSRGDRYLRATGLKNDGLVVLDDPAALQRDILGIMAEAAPAVAGAINDYLVPVAEQVFDDWPVETGLSRSLLSLTFDEPVDGVFVATLASRAPYTMFIHRGRPARELFKAGEEAARRMAEDIAEVLRA